MIKLSFWKCGFYLLNEMGDYRAWKNIISATWEDQLSRPSGDRPRCNPSTGGLVFYKICRINFQGKLYNIFTGKYG